MPLVLFNSTCHKKMNIIEKIKADLAANGLNETQIEAIVKAMVEKEKHMSSRWNDDVEEYPEGFYNLLWALCKTHALEYIEANCPKAWFRAVFDPKDPIHAQLAK